MKKVISFVAAALVGIVSMTAQDNYKTVKGYVLDTNGNPIAGAEVMPTGGGTSAITDADGSFTMNVHPYLKTLTATYAGMGSKKLKVSYDNDMVFRMKSAWRTRGFICLMGNLGFNGAYTTYGHALPIGGGGVMGGVLGKWGAYGKVTYGKREGHADITATVGLIKGCAPSFYVYLGVGYGSLAGDPEYIGTDEYGVEKFNFKTNNGAACDLGFIIKPSKHFTFSIGATLSTAFGYDYKIGADIGAGYVF
ncbi:MAG: hypothetical protein HDS04_06810 [Bacteroides sp.]|nr:hypothetical protein [Bacteroides sp.]